MNGSVAARIERENEALRERLRSLATARVSGEVCAIEAAAAEDGERAEQRDMVRAALSEGVRPEDLGPAFIVTMAECAYEVDWEGQFSFWPELSKILGAPGWDPRDFALREQCTAAFQAFATEFGGLRPQGRFADCYPHVSWPLFHAVLPRAAQKRMSQLLARATADPRFVVAADGCVDERELTGLLREFAARSAMPAYFEGILQHPTLGGRLGASLLSASRTQPRQLNGAGAGLSDDLIARLLRDLRENRVARDQLQEAAEEVGRKEERAKRRQRASDESLDPPRAILVLERTGPSFRLFLEVGPLDAPAREWRPLATLISAGDARVTVNIGDAVIPVGYLKNLAFGAITIEAPWPAGRDAAEISMMIHSAGGQALDEQVTGYFARARREVRLPMVFQRQSGGCRFLLASPEMGRGADVAVVAAAQALHAIRPFAEALGLEIAPVHQSPEVQILLGVLPSLPSLELEECVRRLGLRLGRENAEIRPVLVPALRTDKDVIVWPEGEEPFVQVSVSANPLDLGLTMEDGGNIQSISIMRAAGDHLVARLPPAATGSLVLRRGGEELARVQVVRQPRPAYREPPSRFRAVVMPSRPTRAHLLGDACWLDVAAPLPGIRLTVTLSAGDLPVEEPLAADAATPLRTARLIASMRRRIEHVLGEQAALRDYELRVSNADELALPALVERFPPISEIIGFDVTDDRAMVRVHSDADPATLSQIVFKPEGVREAEALIPLENIDAGTPEGLYLARTRGAVAALAWAASLQELPRIGPPALPVRGVDRGVDRALVLVDLLRACEAAALAPAKRVGRAFRLRHAAVRLLERELIASLCGCRWLEREERSRATITPDNVNVEHLVAALAPLLWVPRAWLRNELPRLIAETNDPVEALKRVCLTGVGDALRATDERYARHLLLLFTRAAMASSEEDAECMRWANADVRRPRLVRLFYLGMPTGLARQAEATEQLPDPSEAE